MLDGYHLMIPGPTALPQDVLREMARPVVPHYGTEWTEFYNQTTGLLRRIFQTEGRVFVIPGSGSAGLEAAIGSSLGDTSRLLVLSNGFFGDRIAEIAVSLRETTEVIRLPVDCPISVEDLDQALAQAEGITAVALVHSESSSGLLNPIEALGQECRRRRLLFIVDAISSLGGVELGMDEMEIDVCISASQKCLDGPPGLALVAVAPSAWERIRANSPRSWYLSLQLWDRYAEMWSDWHPYPITMAVPAFRALRRGAERILAEGLVERIRRHRETAEWTTNRLASSGYRPVFPPPLASPTVLAFLPPSGLQASDVVAYLKAEHRILIAGGMGEFRRRAFRIGNMGIQASKEMQSPVIDALARLAQKERG